MDETTKALLARVTELREPPQRIGESLVSTFYRCEHLTPNDMARLAAAATGHLHDHEFEVAIGVHCSGALFAASIAGGRQVAFVRSDGTLWGAPVKGRAAVIVDDVVRSGTTVRAAAARAQEAGAKVVGFACVVDATASPGSLDGLPLWSAFQQANEQAGD